MKSSTDFVASHIGGLVLQIASLQAEREELRALLAECAKHVPEELQKKLIV